MTTSGAILRAERASSTHLHTTMANVMKELMDIFHAETLIDDEQYERNQVFNTAENLTNNCHQKSASEIEEFLVTVFTANKGRIDATANEKEAWDDALLLVEAYFD